ncbi:MAG: GAF domain-containing protein [Chloroflexi bacterium]|nr:MAG: GAF domain-containing protein [Chloroflexota bacterium]
MSNPADPSAEADESLQQVWVAPLKLRDVTIGDLQFHGLDNGREWTENEQALIDAVVDQVVQAAENLRLLNETQERASREQLIGQISDKLRRAPDFESLMKIGVEELARALGPNRTFVRMGGESQLRQDAKQLPPTTDSAAGPPSKSDILSKKLTPPGSANGRRDTNS